MVVVVDAGDDAGQAYAAKVFVGQLNGAQARSMSHSDNLMSFGAARRK